VESYGSNLARARGDKPAKVKCTRCGAERVLAAGQDVRSLPPCSCRIIRRPAGESR
jgi:hypothetical protein